MKIEEIRPKTPGMIARIEEPDHAAALERTGFWGEAAAGCIFLARTTGRIGIVHRAGPEVDIEQPGTWGTIGGAINKGHDPEQTVFKESSEEVGYHPRPGDHLVPWDVFESGSFRYTTFIFVVADEFRPKLNWEAQGFNWFELGHWPQPLHFGLKATLDKAECMTILEDEVQNTQAT